MAEAATVDVAIDKALAYLREKIRIEAAYLFGSQRIAEAHDRSEIDLAVFSPDVDNMDLFARVRLSCDVSRDCDRRLEVHPFETSA